MITEEIIRKFFEGKCDAREVAIVETWLRENPARLKEYIGEEEWEDFQPAQVLSPDTSGKLWDNINKAPHSPSVFYSYFRWLTAAAAVLLVAGLSWFFIVKGQKTGAISPIDLATAKTIVNTTAQKMMLRLSDGSTVELLPKSTISYPESFSPAKRAVILNGEASFNIAKDAARPFSVYSNSVSIAVLGTRFTVNSFEGDSAAKVVLHEGSVVVKVSNSSSADNKKEYYLSPGDIFLFKKAERQVRALSARVLHLEKDKDSGYVFSNYPLDIVFDQLQFIYNTKIIYNKAQLGNRTFIGKIDKKDPLDHILKSISLLNNFGLHKQGGSFIISQSPNPY